MVAYLYTYLRNVDVIERQSMTTEQSPTLHAFSGSRMQENADSRGECELLGYHNARGAARCSIQ